MLCNKIAHIFMLIEIEENQIIFFKVSNQSAISINMHFLTIIHQKLYCSILSIYAYIVTKKFGCGIIAVFLI